MAKLALAGGPKLRAEAFPGWPPRDDGFLKGLAEVLEDGRWGIGGPKGDAACREFARFHDAQFAVACTSGTTALDLCLRAVGVSFGDEVIVPPYTFIASASSVISVGAVPVFADVDRTSACLDPAQVEAQITPLTKAIIAVHIAGMPCDMDALRAVASRHGLALIEDCAQAHGAEYSGRKIGALGDCGAFSFQSSKNVCAGEGGMMLTNRRELWERAWSFHNIGRVPDGGWYDHRVFGTNLRMTEFQAALVLRGLELLPEHMDLRDACALRLRQLLDGIPGVGYQSFPPGATRCAWHLFLFLYDREQMDGLPRDRFLEALAAEGIPVTGGYNPLYREGMFRTGWDPARPPFSPSVYRGHVNYDETRCPGCEHLCDDGSFWLYQSALLGTPRDMDDIADAILKVRENLHELR